MFECWVNSPKNRAYVITNMINRVRNNLKLKIEKMNIDKQLKINKKKKTHCPIQTRVVLAVLDQKLKIFVVGIAF